MTDNNTWVEHHTGIMLLAHRDYNDTRINRLISIADAIENNDSNISYLKDHKGFLTVSWHKFDPLLAHELSVLWSVIGIEPRQSIEHLPEDTAAPHLSETFSTTPQQLPQQQQ